MSSELVKYKRFLVIVVVLVFSSTFLWRCAKIVSPEGGPKDSIPPYVVGVSPGFNVTNFDEEKIVITFSEYIQIKDQQKEFFTSPLMDKPPTLTVKGKGIEIVITDTLKENQTYSLNFGNSIRDNNEGNPLNGLRYVFSTGDKIDDMIISGYTVSASQGDSMSKTLIFFYPADLVFAVSNEADSIPDYDSTLFNLRPSVVGKSENNGIFIAQNLKPIDYRVYAIKDDNGNFTYDPGVDVVGFLDTVINPLDMPAFVVDYDTTRKYLVAEPQTYFRMFTDTRFLRQNLAEYSRPEQHKVELKFNAPHPDIKKISFEGIDSTQIITEYVTQGRDTINYWLHVPSEELPDSLFGEVIYLKHDSINNLVPDTAKLTLFWKHFESKEEEEAREEEEEKREDAEKDSLKYIPPVVPNPFSSTITQGDLNPEKNVTMNFVLPLVRIDTAAIQLIRYAETEKIARKGKMATGEVKAGEEGEKAEEVEKYKVDYSFIQDSIDMHKWVLSAAWLNGSKYAIEIPAGAFENVAGQQNDTIRSELTVLLPDKFGKISVNVKGKTDSANYVLYLLNEGGSVLQEKRDVTTGTYHFNYIPEGNVRLRILDDINDNGVWDTGNLIKRRQPERTETYASEIGEELIAIKVNWEIELDADMSQIFAPITFESVNEQLRKMEAIRLEKLLEERAKRELEERNKGSKSSGMGGFGGGLGGLKTAP